MLSPPSLLLPSRALGLPNTTSNPTAYLGNDTHERSWLDPHEGCVSGTIHAYSGRADQSKKVDERHARETVTKHHVRTESHDTNPGHISFEDGPLGMIRSHTDSVCGNALNNEGAGTWHDLELTATSILRSLKSAPFSEEPDRSEILEGKEGRVMHQSDSPTNKKRVQVARRKTRPSKLKLLAGKFSIPTGSLTVSNGCTLDHTSQSDSCMRVVSPCPPSESPDESGTMIELKPQGSKKIKAAGKVAQSKRHARTTRSNNKLTSPMKARPATASSSSPSRSGNKSSNAPRRHVDIPNMDIIESMTDQDVLTGRGNGIAMLAGNVKFRRLVQAQRNRYCRSARHLKAQIAQDIIEAVHASGGRFLEKLESSESANGDLYRLMEPGRILEKTSQALRERAR